MRLINCSTLQLEEFFGSKIPQYAILSHTWGDEEVSFADLPFGPSTKARAGYRKIAFTCAQASRDGLNYAWIDTCCIDKSSSSELSEAINSMFAWYRDSTCSYAYLSDVLVTNMKESFSKSRWFTRGWTLQELLAPKDVIFYDRQWNEMGKKSEHADWISEIAGIDVEALLQPPNIDDGDVAFSSCCVAKKMSWASQRETTRPEDIAYCLLGIFDVNMPLLYGEGDRAFLRLQEEIIRRTDDDSILAWGLELEMEHPLGLVSDDVKVEMAEWFTERDMLASSPKDFVNCANLKYTSGSTSPFTLTNVGLEIHLPLIPVYQPNDEIQSQSGGGWIGLLSCSSGTSQEFLGIPLVPAINNQGPTVGQMTRVHIDTHKRMTPAVTLLVGPRAAVRSTRGTILISRYGMNDLGASYYYGDQQIIVNQSRNLQKIGYRVRNVKRSNITKRNGGVVGYDPIWNPETLVLTLENRRTFGEMIRFCFEQPRDEQTSKFTIFIHTDNDGATVREGDTFSKDDKRGIYGYLVDQSTQDDTDNIIIPGSEGKMFKISARVHKTEVYRHRIFEVIIKAVQVVTSTSAVVRLGKSGRIGVSSRRDRDVIDVINAIDAFNALNYAILGWMKHWLLLVTTAIEERVLNSSSGFSQTQHLAVHFCLPFFVIPEFEFYRAYINSKNSKTGVDATKYFFVVNVETDCVFPISRDPLSFGYVIRTEGPNFEIFSKPNGLHIGQWMVFWIIGGLANYLLKLIVDPSSNDVKNLLRAMMGMNVFFSTEHVWTLFLNLPLLMVMR